jgi:hypothetical protein
LLRTQCIAHLLTEHSGAKTFRAEERPLQTRCRVRSGAPAPQDQPRASKKFRYEKVNALSIVAVNHGQVSTHQCACKGARHEHKALCDCHAPCQVCNIEQVNVIAPLEMTAPPDTVPEYEEYVDKRVGSRRFPPIRSVQFSTSDIIEVSASFEDYQHLPTRFPGVSE